MHWSIEQILGSFVSTLTNKKYFTWERTMNNVDTKSEIERDLGVQVDKDLRFSQHIETQVNKANRLLSPIRRSYEHLDAE